MRDPDCIRLPELLAIQMRCNGPADLDRLDKWQRRFMAAAIEGIEAGSATLGEWNELLACSVHEGPRFTNEEARKTLLLKLKGA